MIKLGQDVIDTYTGFEGKVVGRIEYLNGCIRVSVQPHKLQENGHPVESCWIDESQCIPQQEPIQDKPKEGPMTTDPPSRYHQI